MERFPASLAKTLLFVAGAAALVYAAARRLADATPSVLPTNGGMKTGFDPKEINLKSTYENEGELPRDVVDQAGYESFPASDPPAY